jgi:hypothetical protein
MNNHNPKHNSTSTHWSIPLTAPAFTPLQEQQERDELPRKDLEYLRQELYGLDTPLTVPEESVPVLVKRVQLFVKSLNTESSEPSSSRLEGHDYCDTKVYYEALERCPDLVEKETNPEMFLRATNYDIEVSTFWVIGGLIRSSTHFILVLVFKGSGYSSRLSLESAQGYFRCRSCLLTHDLGWSDERRFG